ncbi:MAG: Slx4p interacting protein [Piccolia ochrophora]|nr:MAG: Slx4p interacting protein [Piccolia ochrophora]
MQVDSFARWPLQVRFPCEDVKNTWDRLLERTDASSKRCIQASPSQNLDYPKGPGILNDMKASVGNASAVMLQTETGGGGQVQTDTSSLSITSHVEKSRNLLSGDRRPICTICDKAFEQGGPLATTCPRDKCHAITHLTCLSARFLSHAVDQEAILPVEGTCPMCNMRVAWIDVVKEVSVRIRGGIGKKLLAKSRSTSTQRRMDCDHGRPETVTLAATADVRKDVGSKTDGSPLLDSPELGVLSFQDIDMYGNRGPFDEEFTAKDLVGDDATSVLSFSSPEASLPDNPEDWPREQVPIVIADSDSDGTDGLR